MLTIRRLLALSLIGLASCTGGPGAPPPDSRRLELAEKAGYGYKTSNLMLLDEKLKEPTFAASLAPYQVRVPAFAALSSREVIDSFREEPGLFARALYATGIRERPFRLDLDARWTAIVQLASENENNFFAPDVTAELQALREDIKLAAQASEVLAQAPAVRSLIESAKKGNFRLMVRSSGREDTAKIANAGGNESVANVAPQDSDLMEALGVVVASYFSEKSLSQRLEAKDDLSAPPFTPVLFQEMVGEKAEASENDSSQIPVGCVGYTEEPNAGLKTIVMLQCAFGHNQGVVDNQVVSDVYYVDTSNPSAPVYSVINQKPQRLVPGASKKLERTPNPGALRNARTLDNATLLTLVRALRGFETLFDRSIDVELALWPESKRIEVLQARPLVKPTNPRNPSYLKDTAFVPKNQVLSLEIISSGYNEVQSITKPEELYFAETADLGLKELLASKEKMEQTKALVVKNASTLGVASHAIATLRGAGKVVIAAPKDQRFARWTRNLPLTLLLDGQQGTLVNLQGKAVVLSDVTVNGFATYPLPLRRTVEQNTDDKQVSPNIRASAFAESYEDLVASLRAQVIANDNDQIEKRLTRIAQKIRADLQSTSKQARCEKECPPDSVLASATLEKLAAVDTWSAQVAASKKLLSQDDLLARLFHFRFIEALLLQESRPLTQFSAASLTRGLKEKQAMAKEELGNTLLPSADAIESALAGPMNALSDAASADWIELVGQAYAKDTSLEQQRLVTEAVGELGSLGILGVVVNLQKSDPAYPKSGADLILKVESQHTELARIQAERESLAAFDPGAWENPAHFEQNLANLARMYTTAVDPYVALLSPDASSTKLETQVGILALWAEVIELTDQSIKVLKGSSQYRSEDERARDLKGAITAYMELLKKVYQANASLQNERNNKEVINWHDKISQISPLASELNPSTGFNVNGNLIDGPSRNYSGGPKTLDDYFTVIHQSLIGIIANFNKSILFERIRMPETLRAFALQAQEKVEDARIARLEIKGSTLTVRVNVPMRNHSFYVDLSHTRKQAWYHLRLSFIRPLGRGQAGADYGKLWAAQVQGKMLGSTNQYDRTEFEVALPETVAPENIADMTFYAKQSFRNSGTFALSAGAWDFLLTTNAGAKGKSFAELVRAADIPRTSPTRFSYFIRQLERKDFSVAAEADYVLGENILSPVDPLRGPETYLLEALLKNNQSVEHSKTSLIKTLKMNTAYDYYVMRLVTPIVEHGEMLKEALEITKPYFFVADTNTFRSAFKILSLAVKNGQGEELAGEVLSLNEKGWKCEKFQLIANLLEAGHRSIVETFLSAHPSFLGDKPNCYPDFSGRIQELLKAK